MELEELKNQGEAPEFLTEIGYKTLLGGYLLFNETPKGMWSRVARTAANILKKPELEEKFFNMLWKGWVGLATPVASNMGTNRGLPISCYSISPMDSTSSILEKGHELAMLTKNGGGVGVYMGDLRPAGSKISTGGTSEGMIPFAKIYDSVTVGISQGNVRRGAAAIYLPVDHGDIKAFLRMRRPEGDPNRQCLNLHHAVCIPDSFMNKVQSGDESAQELLREIYKARLETGEPYIFYSDNVNSQNPEAYTKNNLKISTSNICCLPGEELVYTKNGIFPIKNIVGQEVEVWDGEMWTKTHFELKGHVNQMVKITFIDGSETLCTSEHRFPTTEGTVLAADLKPKMVVKTHEITINDSKNDAKGAYLKGFLIGDGTADEKKALLYLYEPKFMCEKRILSSTAEVEVDDSFRSDAIITPNFTEIDGHQRKILQGLTTRKSLLSWATVYKREFPLEVFSWSKKSQADFIAGVMDADGTAIQNDFARCYQIASVEKDWLLNFQKLLKCLGIQSSLGLMRKSGFTDFNDGYGAYKTKDAWRLTVSNSSAYKLADLCSFERIPTLERPSKKGPYKMKPRHGIIKSVEVVSADTDVFSCSVPTTSFYALADGRMTGNSEIVLYTDHDHTFVCCLSSLNLAKWHEWKDTDTVELSVYLLDAVLTEFIEKAQKLQGLESAVRSAIKGRALGLGVMGWHTLLQQEHVGMGSFRAKILNKAIFKNIQENALKASKKLAEEFGEPEWCKGTGLRSTHLIAIAPTASNSLITGNISAGIEPINANAYVKKTAKGTFIEFNPLLKKRLQELGKDTEEVWNAIVKDEGSVRGLDFLSEEDKDVFKTAFEIDQLTLIDLAADRQPFICQAQSLNLFFSKNVDPQYFHEVHWTAWQKKVKTLYYVRSSSVLRADLSSRGECSACEG